MMTAVRTPYENLLRQILNKGVRKSDRTGTGTISLFGPQISYDLELDGFPLITTKFVAMRLVVSELLWFLSGSTNIKPLQAADNHIWDEWADQNGDLGPVYGHQWRSWPTPDGGSIDQMAELMERLKSDPDSRRHVVSAWNVADIPAMALPPCHLEFQFYVAEGRLSCKVHQRSADMFLGVPFNIASYALLTHIVAQQLGLRVGQLIWSGGDCHIYLNHIEQVELLISREAYPYPTLKLRPAGTIFEHVAEDVEVFGYQHGGTIKAPIAV
jgi:thymidylate synthase